MASASSSASIESRPRPSRNRAPSGWIVAGSTSSRLSESTISWAISRSIAVCSTIPNYPFCISNRITALDARDWHWPPFGAAHFATILLLEQLDILLSNDRHLAGDQRGL